MATPIYVCGAECGLSSTTSNHAHLSNRNGTPNVETSIVRSGDRAWRFTASASQAAGRLDDKVVVSTRHLIGQFYIRFVGSLPTDDCCFIQITNTVLTTTIAVGYNSSTGKIECLSTTNNAVYGYAGGGVTPSTDTWIRIDFYANVSANPWTIDAQVDGVPLTQATLAVAAADLNNIRLGLIGEGNDCTGDIVIDDIVLSQTGADYPLFPSFVVAMRPTGDGTHNTSGTGNFFKQDGTDMNGRTDGYTQIDDNPFDTGDADGIEQRLDTSGTLYTEHTFGSHGQSSSPNAVSLYIQYKGVAGLSYDGGFGMYDGTTAATTTFVDHTGTTIQYQSLVRGLNPSGGAWTATILNNIRARLGYGTDVSPDFRFMACMIEAAFPNPTPSNAPRSMYQHLVGSMR